MSLRSIATGISEAYSVIKNDKRELENAMRVASDPSIQGAEKIILDQAQTAKVDGKIVVAIDDGASRRIFPL